MQQGFRCIDCLLAGMSRSRAVDELPVLSLITHFYLLILLLLLQWYQFECGLSHVDGSRALPNNLKKKRYYQYFTSQKASQFPSRPSSS